MADIDPITLLTIDGLNRLASISFYDFNRVPPGTRMYVENNWSRDDTYQCWKNEVVSA